MSEEDIKQMIEKIKSESATDEDFVYFGFLSGNDMYSDLLLDEKILEEVIKRLEQ